MYMNYLEILLKCRFWSNMSLVRAWDSEFLTNSQWNLKLLVPGPDFFCLPFPGGSAGKQSVCNTQDLGSIPGLGRSPGEGNDYPPQYSGLEYSLDFRVRPVAKSQTRPSDFHFHCIGNCWFGLDPLLDLVLGGWMVSGSWSRASFKLIFQRCFEQFY